MLHAGHRLSKDIDAFISDPQYLPILSPRLGGEDIWACDTFSEAANHLKPVYPEGELTSSSLRLSLTWLPSS